MAKILKFPDKAERTERKGIETCPLCHHTTDIPEVYICEFDECPLGLKITVGDIISAATTIRLSSADEDGEDE